MALGDIERLDTERALKVCGEEALPGGCVEAEEELRVERCKEVGDVPVRVNELSLGFITDEKCDLPVWWKRDTGRHDSGIAAAVDAAGGGWRGRWRGSSASRIGVGWC